MTARELIARLQAICDGDEAVYLIGSEDGLVRKLHPEDVVAGVVYKVGNESDPWDFSMYPYDPREQPFWLNRKPVAATPALRIHLPFEF